MQLSRIQKFSWEDAPVRLGVGKNMARSIRYWVMPSKWKRMQHGSLREDAVGGKNESPPLAQQVHPQLPPPIRRLAAHLQTLVLSFKQQRLGSVSRRPRLWLLHLNLLSPPAMPLPGIYVHYFRSVEFSVDDFFLLFVITEIACQSQLQTR